MGMLLRVLVVAGLAIDAYTHAHLAHNFKFNNDGKLTGEQLFLIEAGVAAVVALLVLFRPQRATYALAFLVAAGGVAAVLIFSYYNVGSIFGLMPTIYEPFWYPEKYVSLIGEAIAAIAAPVAFVITPSKRAA